MTLGVKVPNYAPGSDMHIPDQAGAVCYAHLDSVIQGMLGGGSNWWESTGPNGSSLAVDAGALIGEASDDLLGPHVVLAPDGLNVALGIAVDLYLQNNQSLFGVNFAGDAGIRVFRIGVDNKIDIGDGSLTIDPNTEAAEFEGAVTFDDAINTLSLPTSNPGAGNFYAVTGANVATEIANGSKYILMGHA